MSAWTLLVALGGLATALPFVLLVGALSASLYMAFQWMALGARPRDIADGGSENGSTATAIRMDQPQTRATPGHTWGRKPQQTPPDNAGGEE